MLLMFCCSINYSLATSKPIPVAKNGVLDLRHHSFDTNVKLDGEWLFYWNQLLSPSDTNTLNASMVNFPFRWTETEIAENKHPAFGYATYKLQVLLNPAAPPLRLEMPETFSAYALYINGKLALSDGKVGKTKESTTAHWEVKFLNLVPQADTLNLVLQISNFVHSKAGIKKSLIIGEKNKIGLDRRRTEAIDLLLTGCLIMGGLFFLGLYFLGNRDKATLLFALFSIVYSYRIMGAGNYAFHTIFPHIDWYITARLEYITLFLSVGLFGLYTLYLYPEDVNNKTMIHCSLVCMSFVLMSLTLSPLYFTQLLNPFLVITAFWIAYIPYVYVKAYKKRRPGAVFALISATVMMSIFTISLLHYWMLMPQLQLISFGGYVSFFFLQSLVLSHRLSFVLTKARKDAEMGLIAKSEFLSTMSHEIRTPLNAVIGMSHVLIRNNPREDQRKELDVMLFSASNLLNIVNDILDYNKIEAGKVNFERIEMDLASICKNIADSLQSAADEQKIELKLSVDPALQNKVYGDPTRTSQIITNLVHNAIKFTRSGSVELNILTGAQSPENVTFTVQVKDTGIGISPEKQKVIFERFTQADSSTSRGFGGTGLGLAICKKLLELQQSSLKLVSEVNKGSVFYFTQTLDKGTAISKIKRRQNKPQKENNKSFEGISILLVEDNAMNVLVAKNFLQHWGARVDVAVNGLEALEKLDTAKHRLVLMDLHMPIMDGYTASTNIRAKGINIPIIALTANLPNEIEEDIKMSGINDIVVKPFLPDDLYKKICQYLNISDNR